jgi:hypothetical protein
MTPNNLTRLEDPAYGKQTLSSLKRIASALDVALVVRFVPFSQYVQWLSGTPYFDEGLRPEALAVPSFEEEEKRRAFENITPRVSVSFTINFAGMGNGVTTGTITPPQKVLEIVPAALDFPVPSQNFYQDRMVV